MKPNELTLEGFTGVRSGLGREAITLDLRAIPESAQVVALVGPNGTSKTTILDNLHPYRIMPSRSNSNSIGSFSYWDHLCSPTAKKSLFWEHGGREYQSVLTFRSTGKTKKMDCYLLAQDKMTGQFAPVTLPDGTTSDGKTDTYDKCVASILGAPETFFMSMFSAQTKKSLTSYGASEIKALLGAILEQGDLRELSEKANLVVKLLRFELEKLQGMVAQSRTASEQITRVKADLNAVIADIHKSETLENVHAHGVDAARKALAVLEAKRDALAKDDEQREYLNGQIAKTQQSAKARKEKIRAEAEAELKRLTGEDARAKDDLTAAVKGLENLESEVTRLGKITAQKTEIDQACQQLPAYRSRIAEIDTQLKTAQAKLGELRAIQEKLLADTANLSRLETSGSAKSEILATLRQTASLIQQVPCKDSALQRQCPLLENANVAQVGVAKQEAALLDMRKQYREARACADQANAKLVELPTVEAAVAAMTRERNELADKSDAASRLCGMAPMVEDAGQRLLALDSEVTTARARIAELTVRAQEFARHIVSMEAKRDEAIRDVDAAAITEIKDLEDRLTTLAKPISQAEIEQARNAVHEAIASLDAVRTKIHAQRDKRIELCGRLQALQSIQAQAEESVKQATLLADEIAKWKILEKGLGTSGLIALMIDDAGPEIALLCNELLQECYGGRFSVRLDTQRETAGGNLKEDFDVVVTDNHRGEAKSLAMMSGGERVWVNESLYRAIALYVGQSSGTQYHTLFSDETDGPLDPERKRQHFQMKRAVLARGGYQREYFITQTPEVWEMADHIIDVTKL